MQLHLTFSQHEDTNIQAAQTQTTSTNLNSVREEKYPHLVCLCPQQRYDDLSVVVPNHPPEVLYGARQRILGNDELTALPVALQEHDRGSASDLLLLFTATWRTHCTLILVKHIYPTHANT